MSISNQCQSMLVAMLVLFPPAEDYDFSRLKAVSIAKEHCVQSTSPPDALNAVICLMPQLNNSVTDQETLIH